MARLTRLLPVLFLALGLAACAQVRGHWPFKSRELPVPVAVHELTVVVAPDAAMPIVLQFWERNTLVVDLQGVAASGALSLKPAAGQPWPVRLAFRAAPGRFEVLEVRGAQRALLSVSGDRGATVVTMPLAPSVTAGATPELTLRWGAAGTF
jgi:hypothetical protein